MLKEQSSVFLKEKKKSDEPVEIWMIDIIESWVCVLNAPLDAAALFCVSVWYVHAIPK